MRPETTCPDLSWPGEAGLLRPTDWAGVPDEVQPDGDPVSQDPAWRPEVTR